MGTWSHTSFGNDDATDFSYDVGEMGVRGIEQAILAIERLSPDDYIEVSNASIVIAAGEVLAAANGKPSADLPEQTRDFSVQMGRDAPWQLQVSLRARASAAIARVLQASELKELWEKSSDFGVWRADVEALIERLK